MLSLMDPNERSVGNLSNVRCEACRYFRNKEREYLKTKIDELETNSKINISETCTGASVTLRRVTTLELI